MQNFLVSELKPHPKHDYFFDNISGGKDEFLHTTSNGQYVWFVGG